LERPQGIELFEREAPCIYQAAGMHRVR